MALANVSVLLSQWGYKTLIVDWDLEAPGLENYFTKYGLLTDVAEREGIIDILSSLSPGGTTIPWRGNVIQIKPESGKAPLHLLTAGKRDEKRNDAQYFKKVRDFDVQEFYLKNEGGEMIEQLRREWREDYDFALIDSRTGRTDIGGICTVQLPDILVLFFTATEQGLKGTIQVARQAVAARKDMPFDRTKLLTVPIASRLDVDKEFKLSQGWLARAAERLADLYADWLPMKAESLDILELTKIPYKAYFSFEEKLAVMEEGRRDRASLRDAYTTLAALLASELRDIDKLLKSRDEYVNLATQAEVENVWEPQVYISYDHRKETGEWLTEFQENLMNELRLQTGEDFSVFLDRSEIRTGESWQEKLESVIDQSAFLIAIITPGYFKNSSCRAELERFLHRERKLQRDRLIYPIYYVDTPLLHDKDALSEDDLASAVATRQHADWRSLRFEGFSSPKMGKAVADLAGQISKEFHRMRPSGSV